MAYNTHCRMRNTNNERARYLRAASTFEENWGPSRPDLEAKNLPITYRNLPDLSAEGLAFHSVAGSQRGSDPTSQV